MSRSSILFAGFIALAFSLCLGLALGASWLSPFEVFKALLNPSTPTDAWIRAVLVDVRLPRLLLAVAIGASLAQSGVVLQALFRNPLAEQSLLGISGGAALAAACWLVFAPAALSGVAGQLDWLALPLASTVGAFLAAMLVIALSRSRGRTDISSLLLTGLSINAMAGAGIALLQTLASDAALRDITLWFYGSLGRAAWGELLIGLPLLTAIALWLPREARALDALLLGEAEAAHLGVSVESLKRRLLLLISLAAAGSIVLAGIIGFVGLIVPHLLRRILGSGHRLLLPAAGLFGATLLVLADTAARTLFAPLEVPVGVLTALIGVPVFLMLLRRRAP